MSIVNSITIRTIVKKDPEPRAARTEYSPLLVLRKIASYVEDLDAGAESDGHQWNYLKALFLQLQNKKHLSEHETDILKLIEPIILKYGESDKGLSALIEGSLLNRWARPEE